MNQDHVRNLAQFSNLFHAGKTSSSNLQVHFIHTYSKIREYNYSKKREKIRASFSGTFYRRTLGNRTTIVLLRNSLRLIILNLHTIFNYT